jgi:MFS family permease
LLVVKESKTMTAKNRDLNLVYIISFMDLFAVGLTVPLFSTHLRELGASHFTIGLLSSLYSGLQVISGPVVGSWSDVRDRKSVLTITLVLCSIAYVALGFANSILVIAIVRFALGKSDIKSRKHLKTVFRCH